MTRPAGFSLLEMLLASALAAMLMVGVLGVLPRSQSLVARADREIVGDDAAIDGLVRQMARDILHAESVERLDSGDLSIRGHSRLNPRHASQSHRPVEVTYRLASIDGRDWVVRSQRSLDDPRNPHPTHFLVCTGVTGLRIHASEPAKGPDHQPAPAPTPDASTGADPDAAPLRRDPATEQNAADAASPQRSDAYSAPGHFTTNDGYLVETSLRYRIDRGRVSFLDQGNWYYIEHLSPEGRERVRISKRASVAPTAQAPPAYAPNAEVAGAATTQNTIARADVHLSGSLQAVAPEQRRFWWIELDRPSEDRPVTRPLGTPGGAR